MRGSTHPCTQPSRQGGLREGTKGVQALANNWMIDVGASEWKSLPREKLRGGEHGLREHLLRHIHLSQASIPTLRVLSLLPLTNILESDDHATWYTGPT